MPWDASPWCMRMTILVFWNWRPARSWKPCAFPPGPSHPRNAGLCLEFLKRLPASVPVLGVCLGHQLLGYFAGAEVSRAPYVMHGKSSDIIHDGAGLFSGLPNPMTVGRYHSLVVQSKEDEPNPRFTVTSRGPEGEVMALRYNDRPWVGIQFHPESILTPNGLQLLGNFPDNVVPSGQKEKRISRILDALAAGQDLTADMAAAGFADIMDGRMTPAQAGCFLMGLRMKGETPLEMAHAVGIALGRANRVEGLEGDCIDVVGTGGRRPQLFQLLHSHGSDAGRNGIQGGEARQPRRVLLLRFCGRSGRPGIPAGRSSGRCPAPVGRAELRFPVRA